VTLAWADANGPVAGYSVYVQRGDQSAFKHEADVTNSNVTLSGEPGSTARVTVAAFDAERAYGPSSPTSPAFTFPNADGTSNASAASSGSGGSAASSGGSSGSSGTSGSGSDPAASRTADPGKEPASALPGTLVWQAGDAFRLTDTDLVTTRLFARPQEGAQLVAMADFDADGRGDLLWLGASAQLGYTPGSALGSSRIRSRSSISERSPQTSTCSARATSTATATATCSWRAAARCACA
jgi:hypothetical protein